MLGSGTIAANHDLHEAVMGGHHDESGCAFATLASGGMAVADFAHDAPVSCAGPERLLPVTVDGHTASTLLLHSRERAPPQAPRVWS